MPRQPEAELAWIYETFRSPNGGSQRAGPLGRGAADAVRRPGPVPLAAVLMLDEPPWAGAIVVDMTFEKIAEIRRRGSPSAGRAERARALSLADAAMCWRAASRPGGRRNLLENLTSRWHTWECERTRPTSGQAERGGHAVTDEEKRMLGGTRRAAAAGLHVLVKLAEACGADRMVEIAAPPGRLLVPDRGRGRHRLYTACRAGGAGTVRTTSDPGSIDFRPLAEFKTAPITPRAGKARELLDRWLIPLDLRRTRP